MELFSLIGWHKRVGGLVVAGSGGGSHIMNYQKIVFRTDEVRKTGNNRGLDVLHASCSETELECFVVVPSTSMRLLWLTFVQVDEREGV